MTPDAEDHSSTNIWEKHFSVDPKDLAYNFFFYDLYSGDEKKLHEHLKNLLEKLKRPDLSGPLYLVIRELLTNSLKAVYKRLYMDYFIKEMGFGDLSYQEWLTIFKTEIESHMADNFANLCREKDFFVECNIILNPDHLTFEIINDGIPSDIEWERLQKSLARASSFDDLGHLFEEETTADDYQEGAGIGMPLITIILKNIHDNVNDFTINIEEGKTVARLHLPVTLFTSAE